MPYHWEDRERMSKGVRSGGLAGHVCCYIGIVFAVLGIVAGATRSTVGLEATHWFLLAIFILVLSVTFFIGMMISWYLKEKK